MSTDLAVIEAALKAATEGPWFIDMAEQTVRAADKYQSVMFDRSCEEAWNRGGESLADANLIANAPAWLAELVERVKVAEAAIERVRAVVIGEDDEEWVRLAMGRCMIAGSTILRALDGDA